MSISTFEGIVVNGAIRLQGNVTLPEKARVYVIIPDSEAAPRARVYSRRLVHPEQAGDFTKKIVEKIVGDAADAKL